MGYGARMIKLGLELMEFGQRPDQMGVVERALCQQGGWVTKIIAAGRPVRRLVQIRPEVMRPKPVKSQGRGEVRA